MIESDPVRMEFDGAHHHVADCFSGLVGHSIDQIIIDLTDALTADGLGDLADHLEGLDPVDMLLNRGIEILNAHRDAVETGTVEAL